MPRSPQFLTALIPPFILAFLVLVLCGCTEQREVIGQAYVAPQTLAVRSQISLKSGSVATVKHGDKVAIVDVQRRLVKILTAGGAEGWVDSADLLSVAQMNQIRKEREADRALPSEGEAKAYEILNVHLEPTRKSPAIAQIKEGVAVAMLARTIAPKNAMPMKSSPLVVEKRPPPSRRSRREQQAKSNFRLPPGRLRQSLRLIGRNCRPSASTRYKLRSRWRTRRKNLRLPKQLRRLKKTKSPW